MMRTYTFILLSWMTIHVVPEKIYGRYLVFMQSVENMYENTGSTTAHLRLVGPQYGKRIYGPVTFHRDVGPVGLKVSNYKFDDYTNEWKSNYQLYAVKNVCEMSSKEQSYQPLMNSFSAKLTDSCTFNKGDYSLTNYSIEPSLRAFTKGADLVYERRKAEAIFTEGPDFKPLFGYAVTFDIVDADKHEHQMRMRTKAKKKRRRPNRS